MITIYTDGACKGNGKADDSAGGFGVFIRYPDGNTRKIWGGEPATTNNRMELLGAIVALQSVSADTPVQIFTDSNYVKDGITKWITNWKKNNWLKSDKKPVLNQDLWQQLDTLTQNRTIDWQWVKGHNGDDGNEMADTLANLGVTSTGDEWQNAAPSVVGASIDDINAQLAHLDDQNNTEQPNNKLKKKKSKKNPKFEKIALTHNDTQNPEYNGDTSDFNPHFRPLLPIPINRGNPERQLIMDTETTGKDPKNGDRIVEIGMVEMVARKLTGVHFHIYLNPDKEMDDEVIGVHGISNEFLVDKPEFAEAAAFIREFCDGAELIAHNASFDMSFLDMEFAKIGQPPLSDIVKVTDTLAMARQMFRGQRNTLDALVQRLNVGKKDRTFHGALLDSEILAEVYLAMTSGQVALNIDEETSNEIGTIIHEKFANLADLLVRSANNQSADHDWRASVLKNQ